MLRKFNLHFLLRDAWLLQTAVVVLFGMQQVRVFFASLAWPFDRNVPLLLSVAPTPMLVFFAPLIILFATRFVRLEKVLISVITLLVSMRFIEQVSRNPRADLLFASLGLVGFAVYFPVAYCYIRGSRKASGLSVTIGIMLGVSIDTALRGIFWTLDLSWQPGWLPIWFVGGLAILLIVLAHYIRLNIAPETTSPRLITALSAFALGPFFYLTHIEYQNINELFVLSGWQFNVVVVAVLISNLVGIVVSILVNSQPPERRTKIFFISQIVLLGSLLVGWFFGTGTIHLLAICFSGISATVSLGFVSRSLIDDLNTYRPGFTRYAHGIGFVIFLILTLLYYILQASMLVSILATLIMIASSLGRILRRVPKEYRLRLLPAPEPLSKIPLFLFSLFILSTSVWIYERDINSSVRYYRPDELRLLTLNAHQGFDAYGGIGVWQQTELIRDEQIDVVAINEASRGWLFNGMIDTLLWMSHQLGYEYTYSPEIGLVTGNAFLSRYPLYSPQTGVFNAQTFPVTSGYLGVTLFEEQGPIQLITAHLAWGDQPEGIEIRRKEISELLNTIEPGYPALILGDMNMRPHESGYALIRASGYQDWLGDHTSGDHYTFNTTDLYKRVDYIFHDAPLNIFSIRTLPVTVSDHLPLLGELCLQDCERAH